MSRATLLQRLDELQAHPKFAKRDIKTVSAILSLEALAQHVKVCEESAAR
ncbi:hypothetical protein SAMN06297251_111117 [Fulvimarina manganoxydans]|uniref:Uncharacterized protein n=1 Tax=Fulvimarina manganoxydans TaxID=937218 RepID=A0A1W2CTJ2_9HYPH|nr:hypothetical protein [Fulvimarina manganoxydans]MCK5932664.1 hypothetical protein [Fulvimarina manganoxydans]MEE2950823.1 hypothetical protein [Pseudomonadota bacterium]SMC88549.1 hypothetical protein SAMN06297251_111117 [Fulvimarina manganoxydans]